MPITNNKRISNQPFDMSHTIRLIQLHISKYSGTITENLKIELAVVSFFWFSDSKTSTSFHPQPYERKIKEAKKENLSKKVFPFT